MQVKRILSALLLVLVAWLQVGLPALAATGVAGRVQVTNSTRAAFRCSTGYVTPATSTGDLSELYGSASKTLYLKRVLVNLAVTANGTFAPRVFLIKRSTANSGGTSATPTVVACDSNNSTTGCGTVKSYTANPTTGTAVGTVASALLGTNYLAVNGTTQPTVLYEAKPDTEPLIARGTGEGYCVNFNGTKPDGSTPAVEVTYEWEAE